MVQCGARSGYTAEPKNLGGKRKYAAEMLFLLDGISIALCRK